MARPPKMTETIELDPRDPTMDEPEPEYPITAKDIDEHDAKRMGFVNLAAKQCYDSNRHRFGFGHSRQITNEFAHAMLFEVANLRERVKALEQAKG